MGVRGDLAGRPRDEISLGDHPRCPGGRPQGVLPGQLLATIPARGGRLVGRVERLLYKVGAVETAIFQQNLYYYYLFPV